MKPLEAPKGRTGQLDMWRVPEGGSVKGVWVAAIHYYENIFYILEG